MASDAAPRFFFVHVMKTGGTSFVFQMTTNFAPAEVYPNEGMSDPPKPFKLFATHNARPPISRSA